MGVVKTTSPRGKEGCDSLLLGFSDAKVFKKKVEDTKATTYKNYKIDVIIRMVARNEFNCHCIYSLLRTR